MMNVKGKQSIARTDLGRELREGSPRRLRSAQVEHQLTHGGVGEQAESVRLNHGLACLCRSRGGGAGLEVLDGDVELPPSGGPGKVDLYCC